MYSAEYLVTLQSDQVYDLITLKEIDKETFNEFLTHIIKLTGREIVRKVENEFT